MGGGICTECPLKLYMVLLRFGLPNPDSDGDGYDGRESVCRIADIEGGSWRDELDVVSPHCGVLRIGGGGSIVGLNSDTGTGRLLVKFVIGGKADSGIG